MRPIEAAVIRTGLVPQDTLKEMRRWGLPIQLVEDTGGEKVIEDLDVVARIFRDALESGEHVRMQDTDLDIIQRWIDSNNQVEGKLILKDLEGNKSTIKVMFCWTLMREVAMPWKSESITELLVDSESYLRYHDEDGVAHKLSFLDTRELYIGDTKAFVVGSVEEVA